MVIYEDDYDYRRFQQLLYLANDNKAIHYADIAKPYSVPQSERLVDIGAYCLMPNHFHILVREFKEGGTSMFMRRLLTAYSMYFNTKYERVGTLFESRFKSKHVSTDEYLKYLYAYMSLNPVKTIDPLWKQFGLKDIKRTKHYLSRYKYSSYLDYLGKRRVESKILNLCSFPEYFTAKSEFDNFCTFWLTYLNESSTRSVLEDGPRG